MATKVETRFETASLSQAAQDFASLGGTVVPGLGGGDSSVTLSDQREPSDPGSDDLSDFRFCPLLDPIFPESVVHCLERLCQTVYNCLAPMLGREPIEFPHERTRNDAERALVEELLEPLLHVDDEVDPQVVEDPFEIATMPGLNGDALLNHIPQNYGTVEQTDDSEAPAVAATKIHSRKKRVDFQAYIRAMEGDLLTVSHGRVFHFRHKVEPQDWAEGDLVQIWQNRSKSQSYQIRNLTQTQVEWNSVTPLHAEDMIRRHSKRRG